MIDLAGVEFRQHPPCDRYLVVSPIVDGDLEVLQRELGALGWEIRHDGQTWCPECSQRARTPKGALRGDRRWRDRERNGAVGVFVGGRGLGLGVHTFRTRSGGL